MRGGPLAAVILNAVALSVLFIGNAGWKCTRYPDQYLSDAPLELVGRPRPAAGADDDDQPSASGEDDDQIISTGGVPSLGLVTGTKDNAQQPNYLRWDMSAVQVPPDWRYQPPRTCTGSKNITNFDSSARGRGDQKIIVHYHLQHNAGTNFYSFANKYTPCATRACWQDSKHCLVSYNEEAEAENIRQNYERYGVQYVSYEVMLPPRFPLPFVSDTARQGIFFTTIVRDPFKRFLTHVRRAPGKKGFEPGSSFWKDFSGVHNIYFPDNLNARWLSGARDNRLSGDHVNIAKCRLQLFDLVIADKLFDVAVEEVMCPLNGWKGGQCAGSGRKEHSSKSDPLQAAGVDAHLIGAWVERLRPSFEIYDYARILSWRQLSERGVEGLPELSQVPSYMDTLANYLGAEVSEQHFGSRSFVRAVTLENEKHYAPPDEFCDRMKEVWTSNPDEVPNAYGIGTLMNGWRPKGFGGGEAAASRY
ncbi:hypothetical protein ACHAXT_012636 [Thalassiosira profunda]